ncbi:MAG: hypothetical protein F4Y97_05520 [Dehalococcoidia bacterium]|nr:hypothetical protein [Dehalococcoidia bacterium]
MTQGSIAGDVRQEAWLDQLATIRRWLAYAAALVDVVLVVALGVAGLVALATFATHLFIPSSGWMTDSEWDAITGWYAGAAQAALPVFLVLNPWLIWRLSRPSSTRRSNR